MHVRKTSLPGMEMAPLKDSWPPQTSMQAISDEDGAGVVRVSVRMVESSVGGWMPESGKKYAEIRQGERPGARAARPRIGTGEWWKRFPTHIRRWCCFGFVAEVLCAKAMRRASENTTALGRIQVCFPPCPSPYPAQPPAKH